MNNNTLSEKKTKWMKGVCGCECHCGIENCSVYHFKECDHCSSAESHSSPSVSEQKESCVCRCHNLPWDVECYCDLGSPNKEVCPAHCSPQPLQRDCDCRNWMSQKEYDLRHQPLQDKEGDFDQLVRDAELDAAQRIIVEDYIRKEKQRTALDILKMIQDDLENIVKIKEPKTPSAKRWNGIITLTKDRITRQINEYLKNK